MGTTGGAGIEMVGGSDVRIERLWEQSVAARALWGCCWMLPVDSPSGCRVWRLPGYSTEGAQRCEGSTGRASSMGERGKASDGGRRGKMLRRPSRIQMPGAATHKERR